MSKMTPAEFRKKYAKSSNETLDILNEYYQYINLTTPKDVFSEVEIIINSIRDIFIDDPEHYKSDPEVYLSIKRLTELLPAAEHLEHKLWKQVPIFKQTNNQRLSKESFYTTKSDSDYNWEDEIYND